MPAISEEFYQPISNVSSEEETPGLILFVPTARRSIISELVERVMIGEIFLALTGPAGAGKTAIASVIRDELVSRSVRVLQVSRPENGGLGLQDIASQVLGKSKPELNAEDIESLFDVITARDVGNERSVVIIDDAQLLDVDAFRYLQLLSNLAVTAISQIIFVGRPEFWDATQDGAPSHLKELIKARWELGPFRRDETREFLEKSVPESHLPKMPDTHGLGPPVPEYDGKSSLVDPTPSLAIDDPRETAPPYASSVSASDVFAKSKVPRDFSSDAKAANRSQARRRCAVLAVVLSTIGAVAYWGKLVLTEQADVRPTAPAAMVTASHVGASDASNQPPNRPVLGDGGWSGSQNTAANKTTVSTTMAPATAEPASAPPANGERPGSGGSVPTAANRQSSRRRWLQPRQSLPRPPPASAERPGSSGSVPTAAKTVVSTMMAPATVEPASAPPASVERPGSGGPVPTAANQTAVATAMAPAAAEPASVPPANVERPSSGGAVPTAANETAVSTTMAPTTTEPASAPPANVERPGSGGAVPTAANKTAIATAMAPATAEPASAPPANVERPGSVGAVPTAANKTAVATAMAPATAERNRAPPSSPEGSNTQEVDMVSPTATQTQPSVVSLSSTAVTQRHIASEMLSDQAVTLSRGDDFLARGDVSAARLLVRTRGEPW